MKNEISMLSEDISGQNLHMMDEVTRSEDL
jgi:hypothetical protein